MIDIKELEAGNHVGFKVIIGDDVIYSTGTITSIEKGSVKIDEFILDKKDLVPILLTDDTLIALGCVQISHRQWRTSNFRHFEFDGIQARFDYRSVPVTYLHLFQNIVSQLREEPTLNN